MITILLILALLTDPGLTAHWDGNGAATIRWSQSTRGCLYRNEAFISCYEEPGEYHISFGKHGPLSGDLRPAIGDVYRLWTPEGVWRAPLRHWRYLPMVL